MEGSEAADSEADLGSPLGSTLPPPSPASPRSGPYGSLQMGWVLPHATRHSWLTRLCLCASYLASPDRGPPSWEAWIITASASYSYREG